MRVYVDSSAAVKLMVEEPESATLAAFCARPDVELVATDLLEAELRRVGQRESTLAGTVSAILDGAALIYDSRMREAASEIGLRVLAPGDESWADR